MQRRNVEIRLSLVAIVLISMMYLVVVNETGSVPGASDFFGHSLGVLGFILMLMTEVLYSLRKRSRSARWGRMSRWLEFHIFTGIVGPYLVLLHSSWKFQGLAGVVTLLMGIIVLSGFIGRYIYTAVPRTADGIELDVYKIEKMIADADAQLKIMVDTFPEMRADLSGEITKVSQTSESDFFMVIDRFFTERKFRVEWQKRKRNLDAQKQAQAKKLQKLLKRRRMLTRQVSSMATARRLLSIWHTVHIPIGMALFTAAFIHIAAALYYVTFQR